MHKKHLAVVPAVAALLAATTLGAHAIDIVVNSGDTVGSQSISGVGDSLLVEAGGVIEVVTGSTYPVYSTGANNTLVNFGGIYSYADCSYGIYAMGNYFSLTNTVKSRRPIGLRPVSMLRRPTTTRSTHRS